MTNTSYGLIALGRGSDQGLRLKSGVDPLVWRMRCPTMPIEPGRISSICARRPLFPLGTIRQASALGLDSAKSALRGTHACRAF